VTDRICVAQIGAAHGVRGELRLRSFTEDPLAFSTYGPLQSEDGKRTIEITSVRPAKDHLIVRVKGVDDRTGAEALRNLRLFVARDALPPPDDDDTFYHADLIGLAAIAPDGRSIGIVAAVHNFGAGDMIEITPAAGGDTILAPFTERTVPQIDLKAKRIIVALPDLSE
jgi:16S rRNA processing protein RimM